MPAVGLGLREAAVSSAAAVVKLNVSPPVNFDELFNSVFALPTISVTRYKADRSDFKYEMRRAVEEIVGEIVEKALDDE